MPGTTPVYGITYPVTTDAPGASAIETLARDVDTQLEAREYVRFNGEANRPATEGTTVIDPEIEKAIRHVTTTVVNQQALILLSWYGFTLSGTGNTRCLIRIRRGSDTTGEALKAIWWHVEPTTNPDFGGCLFAYDSTPGVNPSYVVTMEREPAAAGILRLSPGTTSPSANIYAEQKGTVT